MYCIQPDTGPSLGQVPGCRRMVTNLEHLELTGNTLSDEARLVAYLVNSYMGGEKGNEGRSG